MSKLTMNNTKNEILTALKAAEDKIQELTKGQLNTQGTIASKKVTEVIAASETIISKDTVGAATELQQAISTALEGFVKEIENGKVEIATLDEAIKIKKEEIKELFDIETKANTLAALINAEQNLTHQFALDKAERIDSLKAELQTLTDLMREKKTTAEAEIAEMKAEAAKVQAIQETEWEYDFNRKKKLADDEWLDEKKTREKALAEKEESFNNRLVDLVNREEKMEDLEARVAEIPSLIKQAEEEGFATGKSKAGAEYAFEKRALEAKTKSEIQVLDNKVMYLEKDLNDKNTEIVQLKADLKDAYAKIQEIANRTVESAGNSKMITSLESMIREKQGNK